MLTLLFPVVFFDKALTPRAVLVNTLPDPLPTVSVLT